MQNSPTVFIINTTIHASVRLSATIGEILYNTTIHVGEILHNTTIHASVRLSATIGEILHNKMLRKHIALLQIQSFSLGFIIWCLRYWN